MLEFFMKISMWISMIGSLYREIMFLFIENIFLILDGVNLCISFLKKIRIFKVLKYI